MRFQFYDEAGFDAAQRFLERWMPAAASELTHFLGSPRSLAEPLQVFLSPTPLHNQRFPSQSADVIELIDPDDVETNDRHDTESLAQLFQSTDYAHGITTRTDASLRLPQSVTLDQPAIFLDIETIDWLSEELGVPFESLLGRTAVHELSHVLRGHISSNVVTHGYVQEGDAQRDAWQVLADLMADPFFVRTARAGRVAQVRLAERQPSAYRRFGHAAPDRYSHGSNLLEAPRNWITRPARKILPLTQQSIIEIPISLTSAALGTPALGDAVYLQGDDLIVGPWIVIDRTAHPHREHRADMNAIEARDKANRSEGRYEWLQLRPSHDLKASLEVPTDVGLGWQATLLVKRLTDADMEELCTALQPHAGPLAAAAARSIRLAEEGAEITRALYAARGLEAPSWPVRDPFKDEDD